MLFDRFRRPTALSMIKIEKLDVKYIVTAVIDRQYEKRLRRIKCVPASDNSSY